MARIVSLLDFPVAFVPGFALLNEFYRRTPAIAK
jgi:hypothetical protein